MLRRLKALLRGYHRSIGTPGLVLGSLSFLMFCLGLILVLREEDRLRHARVELLRSVVLRWVRDASSNDLHTRSLLDDAADYRAADQADRPQRRAQLEASLRLLGSHLDTQNERNAILEILDLWIELPDAPQIPSLHWQSRVQPVGNLHTLEPTLLVPPSSEGHPAVYLRARFRLAADVAATLLSLESAYRRVLLALLALSGFTLLSLAVLAQHARIIRDRVAREAAHKATLDLADRTCHELGNAIYVLSNEQRNLTDHLDQLDTLAATHDAAFSAAARRARLDPQTTESLHAALARELHQRGIHPTDDLQPSAQLARAICRQLDLTARYIARTIRELDGFLKASTLPVSLESVDLAAIAQEAAQLLQPSFLARNLSLEIHIAPVPIPPALADRRLLVHALVNLLKNALEASPGPSATVTLQIGALKRQPFLAVQDHGPGIPPDLQARIFEDGFSTKGRGRGRGLAIVQESVRSQHAQLKLETPPDGGCRFLITLRPADRPPPASDHTLNPQPPAPIPAPPDH